MKAGDVVWILRRDGEWRRGVVRAIGSVYVTVGVTGCVTIDCVTDDRYPADVLDAMQALRAATEAVAKARDNVVEAAKAWDEYEPRDERDDGHIDALHSAVTTLLIAERAEAEARARLEALR